MNPNKILNDSKERQPKPKTLNHNYDYNSKSIKQEERAANMIGGRRQPRSGGIPGFKSDAISDNWRVECKRTDKAEIQIKQSDVIKISEEAENNGQYPLLVLEFGIIPSIFSKVWILVPDIIFSRLREKITWMTFKELNFDDNIKSIKKQYGLAVVDLVSAEQHKEFGNQLCIPLSFQEMPLGIGCKWWLVNEQTFRALNVVVK